MCNLWRCLDTLGIAVPAIWQKELGRQFAPFRQQFLTRRGAATSFPCPHDCGCAHEIVPKGKDRFIGVCQCDPWACEDIRYNGKVYTSPSLAGAAARKYRTCNGWTFWQYERAPGDWVLLDELRK